MKGAVLLYGGNKSDLNSKVCELVTEVTGNDFPLQENKDPDIKVVGLDAEKILTADVSEAVQFLQEKPFGGKYKILIILQAEKIQPKTQNLLLKTLEETPSYATIIVASKTLQDIIETVQSRCRKTAVKKLTDNSELEPKVSYEAFVGMSYEKRLIWAEEFAKEEKEDIVALFETWLEQGRGVLKKSPQHAHETIKNLELIKEIKEDISNTNVNTRLALETLVMSIESN